MFWRFGFHPASAIDSLLEKETVTLEELFEEEELLQECKAHNTKLVEFLVKPVNLKKLLMIIVNSDELEEEKKFKFPYIACEVISCEILAICEGLVSHTELLTRFWTFLDTPGPINALKASYFSKVNGILIQRKVLEMIDFIKAQPNFVDRLLQHIANASISELLLKIISVEEIPEAQGIVTWLGGQGLIPKLIERLDPNLEVEVHNTASQTILDIIAVSYQNIAAHEAAVANGDALESVPGSSSLIDQLKSSEIVRKMVTYMLDDSAPNATSTLANVINIVIELIRRYCSEIEQAEYQQHQLQTSVSPSSASASRIGFDLTAGMGGGGRGAMTAAQLLSEKIATLSVDLIDLLAVIGERVEDMAVLLEKPRNMPQTNSISGGTGPLGSERLKTCELFAEILHLQYLYYSSPLFDRLVLSAFETAPDAAVSMTTNANAATTTTTNTEAIVPLAIGLDANSSDHTSSTPANTNAAANTAENSTSEGNSTDMRAVSVISISSDSSSDGAGDSTVSAAADTNTAVSSMIAVPIETDGLTESGTAADSTAQSAANETAGVESVVSSLGKLELSSVEPAVSGGATNSAVAPTPVAADSIAAASVAADSSSRMGKNNFADELVAVTDRFVEAGILPMCLRLFFEFPWNNFLHSVVYDMIAKVFNTYSYTASAVYLRQQVDVDDQGQAIAYPPSPEDVALDAKMQAIKPSFKRLVLSILINGGDLTFKIIEAQQRNDAEVLGAKGARLGFMGHLTYIADEVCKLVEKCAGDFVDEHGVQIPLAHPDWDTYVNGILRDTKERDRQFLGGARPMQLGGLQHQLHQQQQQQHPNQMQLSAELLDTMPPASESGSLPLSFAAPPALEPPLPSHLPPPPPSFPGTEMDGDVNVVDPEEWGSGENYD